jgi:hypothetical protein
MTQRDIRAPRPTDPGTPSPVVPLLAAAALAAVVIAAACALAGCARYEYDGVDLSAHVPEAYLADVATSLERAGGNGGEILEAITTAPAEDREALAFLVAEMPAVDLATADSDLLLESVRLAREARETFPWGAGVPDDVYLHYVLPMRVSQEPLENWRPHLMKQLSERLAGIDSMEEAALEVNRWCGERVGFKPTQRRDQGVFETLASGYGRCEEMMIVHIAALRSVSIPARQAWTPYWTTCDNNHAWTELWVDGSWYYTGACEPADELNRAWFDERVKGAALVLSSVCGTPSGDDDVYREEERYSLVNSIGNYAVPGTLSVVVDDDGEPARGAPVTISVWNFGALRAIARIKTDERGRARISLGAGTYFVCAGSPDDYDWEQAVTRSGEPTSIELDLDDVPEFNAEFWMRYEKPE